jgi:hypothetical protein
VVGLSADALGVGECSAEAGAGVAAVVGVGVGAAAGVDRGAGVGVGRGVGAGVGLGVGFGVAAGTGFGVAAGVAAGVGGGGAVIVTEPPATVPLNLLVLVSAASKVTVWVPTASFVDHECGTPCFQFELPSPAIVWAVPSTTTATWSGAVPFRFR